jgi:Cu-Zn family superoxide dismutase
VLYQRAVALEGLGRSAEARDVALKALPSGVDLHEAEALQQMLSTGDAKPDTASAAVALLGASADGAGIGSISFRDSPAGLVISPQLSGLAEGPHAAHIHEFASCDFANDMAGGAAGGHAFHHGAGGGVAYGDLPDISFDADKTAAGEVVAPFLRVSMVAGKSIVIHAKATGYDNNMRVACGTL